MSVLTPRINTIEETLDTDYMALSTYKLSGTTIEIYKGSRTVGGKKVVIPRTTISCAINFDNFHDSSEAGTYSVAGWRYIYSLVADTSKFAFSTNSPYDKTYNVTTGEVSNIVEISGQNYVYIGAAWWTNAAFRVIFSSSNIIINDSSSEITYALNASGTRIFFAKGVTTGGDSGVINLYTSGFLPGSHEDSKSRVATKAGFNIGHGYTLINVAGSTTSCRCYLTMGGLYVFNYHVYAYITANIGNYLRPQHIVHVDCTFTDTVKGNDLRLVRSKAGSTNDDLGDALGINLTDYTDQYIY